MRILLSILAAVFGLCSSNAAQPETKPTEEEISYNVEQPAEFPGGAVALIKWINENLIYPANAMDSKIEGRVLVKFVVEKDGSISNASIFKSVDPDLDRESIRLVNSMPEWKPGEMQGVPVQSYFILPVTFKLQDE